MICVKSVIFIFWTFRNDDTYKALFLCSERLMMMRTWFIRLVTDAGLEALLKLIQRFIVTGDKFLTHYSIYIV